MCWGGGGGWRGEGERRGGGGSKQRKIANMCYLLQQHQNCFTSITVIGWEASVESNCEHQHKTN